MILLVYPPNLKFLDSGIARVIISVSRRIQFWWPHLNYSWNLIICISYYLQDDNKKESVTAFFYVEWSFRTWNIMALHNRLFLLFLPAYLFHHPLIKTCHAGGPITLSIICHVSAKFSKPFFLTDREISAVFFSDFVYKCSFF